MRIFSPEKNSRPPPKLIAGFHMTSLKFKLQNYHSCFAGEKKNSVRTKKYGFELTDFFSCFRVVQLGPWTNLQIILGNFFFVTKRINNCIISFNGDHSQGEY